MSTTQVDQELFVKTLNNLVGASVDNYYNPYKSFDWPESLVDEQWWMSPELLSVYGTSLIEQFSEQQLQLLSKWESINFYSLNIHGIRELLLEVIKRIHAPGFELPSDFFHHYIGEENEHMWFFAEFCRKYARKIYPDRKIKLNVAVLEPETESFLVFARILIFEEIVDYFNVKMGKDRSLDPVICKINNIHHQDESRHIIFGRQIVKHLHTQLRQKLSAEQLLDIESYLKRYIIASIESLYNPAVYRDAGISQPYQFRTALLQDVARKSYHKKFLKRTLKFFVDSNIISSEDFI